MGNKLSLAVLSLLCLVDLTLNQYLPLVVDTEELDNVLYMERAALRLFIKVIVTCQFFKYNKKKQVQNNMRVSK